MWRILAKELVAELLSLAEVEHAIDAVERFVGQMIANEQQKAGAQVLQQVCQVLVVVAEIELVEAGDGHHRFLKMKPQFRGDLQLVAVEAVVPMQHSHLDHCFDQGFDKLFCFLLVTSL